MYVEDFIGSTTYYLIMNLNIKAKHNKHRWGFSSEQGLLCTFQCTIFRCMMVSVYLVFFE